MSAPADLMLHASDLGTFPVLPTSFDPGEPVTLRVAVGKHVEHVEGWFVARFLDDDPDCGTGPTYRIVGRDRQVWESARCRSGWRTP